MTLKNRKKLDWVSNWTGVKSEVVHLQSDEAECLDSVRQRRIGVGEVRGSEGDSHEPEVREDDVEEEERAGVGTDEEGKQEEGDGENGLRVLVKENRMAGELPMHLQ